MKDSQIITAIVNNHQIITVYFGTDNVLCDSIEGERHRLTESSIEDGIYYGLKNKVTDRVEWVHNTIEKAEEQQIRFKNINYIVIGLNFYQSV